MRYQLPTVFRRQLSRDSLACNAAFVYVVFDENAVIHSETTLYVASVNVKQLFTFLFLLCVVFTPLACKKESPIVSPRDGSDTTSIPADTTSHNFLWTQYTFGGDAGSSLFNDVAIVNDSLAYAVGEVYLKDSLGNAARYNMAIWDGKKWTVQKLYYNYQGQYLVNPIQTVFSSSSNNIWFAGNGISHWDGQGFSEIPIPTSVWGPYLIRELWSDGSSSLYIVGSSGNIAHYDGTVWTKLNSGTSLDIQDIWGSKNEQTGKFELLAVGSQPFHDVGKTILKIEGTMVSALSDTMLPPSLSSIWFVSNQHYYVGGDGIYEKISLSDHSWSNGPLDITTYYTFRIRGIALNDVVAAGGYGEVTHYNGSNWHSYFAQTKLNFGIYYSVAIKGNLIVAVGLDNQRAVITTGRR